MSWQDSTKQERVELRGRRAKRRTRFQALEQRLWDQKRRDARSPADRAALEFDLARKTISRLRDAVERDREWERLASILRGFNGDGQ